jgi:pyruvate-formate lyase-activating enzyme
MPKKKLRNKVCSLAYSDKTGKVYDFPGMTAAFRSGRTFINARIEDCIPMPYGSYLFSLPGRRPVCYDKKSGTFSKIDDWDIAAVSSFLSSGYLRTYLPAFTRDNDSPLLPLWAYCGLAIVNGEFYTPAIRIDDDPRSDPAIHENSDELAGAIAICKSEMPGNSLVKQLSLCASKHNCLCARNFFLSRYEAPLPTTRSCNAVCLGCLSRQPANLGIPASQERLAVEPSPADIAEVIARHLSNVKGGIASFGQGCEGEPLLRSSDLSKAIKMAREKTISGTINLNTNGSLPNNAREIIESGLDSIRISMNSATPEYYTRHYRPKGYSHSDVLRTIEISLEAGIFVSINLFFMPGFTDSEQEVDALFSLLKRYPINMIQTRNLNMDPDFYLDSIGFKDSQAIGIAGLIKLIKREFPKIMLGYYNPSKERFKKQLD